VGASVEPAAIVRRAEPVPADAVFAVEGFEAVDPFASAETVPDCPGGAPMMEACTKRGLSRYGKKDPVQDSGPATYRIKKASVVYS
jgi:hypothetical protein